ncbi:MAG: hypothetical protein WBA24_15695 [Geitlerinemataceae cyanobacterium]
MIDYRKSSEFSQRDFHKYILLPGVTLGTVLIVLFWWIPSQPKSVETAVLDCPMLDESTQTLPLETLEELRGRENQPQTTIRQILGKPNCTLPKMAIRDGALVDRDVYISSDRLRAIVAYENGQYLGYGLEQIDRPGSESKIEEDRSFHLREIELHQTWGIHAGNAIAQHPIVSGLGDISLSFDGKVVAPVDGWVEGEFVLVHDASLRQSSPDCVLFSSPQMPAYLSRLCGFKQRNLGLVEQGMPIGQTNGYLHITLFSYRTNEEETPAWFYVSPSPQLIENLVSKRSSVENFLRAARAGQ